jgi:hypothetical protein
MDVRKLGLVATAALLSALVTVPVSEAASPSAFVGSWSSIDPVDGSTQHLYVIGGTNVQMVYVDEYGTVCVQLGAPTVVFTGRLTGQVDGDDLFAWFKQGGCGPVQEITARMGIGWSFHYDSASDTVFGPFEDGPTTWYRD